MATYLTTDSELTAIADAIREKTGTSQPISYPAGFVNAISGISTGQGGSDFSKYISGTLYYYENSTMTSARHNVFTCAPFEQISLPALESVPVGMFMSCDRLSSVFLPACSFVGNYAFYDCPNLSIVR